MSLEKRIVKFKKNVAHIGGGFLIGVGCYYLAIMRDAPSAFHLGIRFAMFMTLFLLGLSYLGE